ncbi:MAG: thiolase family protein [Planctomycetes bacterium]|nr:thiolase family protein [Planctomycetota bacterium]
MKNTYIYEALRSPIGKNQGIFTSLPPVDLLAEVLKAIVQRAAVPSAEIEDVVTGCVTQVQEQGVNVARMAALAAGFPVGVCGTTVNRLCGSSQQAANFAAAAVSSAMADLVLAAGVESMSRVPMGSDAGPMSDRVLDRYELVPQGIAAEWIAEKWGLAREALDGWSLQSHARAIRATDAGHFDAEIVPIRAGGREVRMDEGPRRDTSLEALKGLPLAFKERGVITAGNSSQISDGAAALLIGSEEAGRRLGLKPRARFVATAIAGVDPTLMLTGPIPATKRVLARAGLKLSDIDLFEVNEAFASVVLAWLQEVGADPAKVNVNGGAIALGHPLGATGARLLTTMVYELVRRKARYGLTVMCIGFGQATATILERC